MGVFKLQHCSDRDELRLVLACLGVLEFAGVR